MWLVMSIRHDLETESGIKLELPDGVVGYAPVFDDREAALKCADGKTDVVEVMEKVKG